MSISLVMNCRSRASGRSHASATALHTLRHARAVAATILVALLLPMFPRPAHADLTTPPPQPGQSALGSADTGAAGAAAFSSATVNPSTGALHTVIPFTLPAARGNVQPQLSLNYASSGGFGVGGRGWSLGVPSIERHNSSGAPRFNEPDTATALDPTQLDHFIFAGQPLVLICRIAAGGTCTYQGANKEHPANELIAGELLPSFATGGGWYYYRLQTETGALARFFWSPDHTRWVVQDKTGATAEYGVPQSSTDNAATDRDGSGRIFRWNVFTQYDAQRTAAGAPANRLLYQWTQKTIALRGTMLGYLSDVFDTPRPGDSAPITASYAHHTHLYYTPSSSWHPSASAPVWFALPAFLLSGVDVTSQDFAATRQRQQVRRYFLTYTSVSASTTDGPPSVQSVQMEGNCSALQNNFEDGTTFLLPTAGTGSTCPPTQTRPPTTFQYAPPRMTPLAVPMPSMTDGTKSPLLFDLNNDGLPDFIDTTAVPKAVAWINSATTANAFVSQPIVLGSTTVLNLTSLAQLGSGGRSLATGAFQMDGRLDLLWDTVDEWATPGHFPFAPSHCPTPNEALFCDPAMAYALLTASQSGGQWVLTPQQEGTFHLTAEYPAEYGPSSNGGVCNTDPCLLGGEKPVATIDANGDGLQDLLTVLNYSDQNSTENPLPSWWQYELRLSKRSLDGTYWPFFGTAVAAPMAGARTDVCIGGIDADAQSAPYEDWNGDSAAYQFTDVDGDGIADMVESGGGTQNILWWPGHGDGVFGACPDGGVQCACASATALSLPVTVPPTSKQILGMHDVTGDGLADIVVGVSGGIAVYVNLGGGVSSFAAPVTPATNPALAFAGALTAIYFVDMDGSGIDDIVMQGTPAGGKTGTSLSFVDLYGTGVAQTTTTQRPGMLIGINNGLGVTTSIAYDTSANLSRAAASAGAAWTRESPQPIHAVVSVTTSDSTGDAYTTHYTYWNPIFDGRDREFLGFQRVRQTTPGDAATLENTETTFFYGACGLDQAVLCVTGPNNSLASYRGLPTLTETFDGGAGRNVVYLSTTHHSYASATLYSGSDDRTVQRVYDAQEDTYLYDDSPFLSGNLTGTVPDVDQSSFPVGYVIRGGNHNIERKVSLDGFGNVAVVADLGDISATPADPAVLTSTSWGIDQHTDAANNWTWRPLVTSVGGSASEELGHAISYTYDAHGNVTDVSRVLQGTTSLSRPSFGAPSPVGASQNGLVHVAHLTYDPLGTGNVLSAQTFPSSTTGSTASRCAEYGYDTAYAQLRTAETIDVGPCGSASAIVTNHGYDRVLGVETLTILPGNERTATAYDGFGRPTSISKADPTAVGLIDPATTTIAYGDTSYGQLVHVSQAAGTTYAANDIYVYKDGLGREIQVVSSGDSAGQWVVSGQVARDTRGRPTMAFVPHFVQAADGGALYSSAPPGVAWGGISYDAFNRITQTRAIDGGITSVRKYHAVSVDSYDGETAKTSGIHVGAFITTTTDGHGRTTRVDAHGNSGVITTQSTYQATGEVTSVSRTGNDVHGQVQYIRYMRYDTLGRLVVNAEPNTSHNYSPNQTIWPVGGEQYWTYAYDDVGELVGTSDARGCGENITYDGAGRLQSQDYSPCSTTLQSGWTAPSTTPGNGDGTEVFYVYEGGALESGRLSDLYDRASHVHVAYDGRGRPTRTDKQVARPGTPASALAARYAAPVYTAWTSYDDRDRVATQSTGATVPGLLAANSSYASTYGPSTVAGLYSPRGILQTVSGSYGPLVTRTVSEADGRPDSVTYGDVAATTTTYSYADSRRRLTEVTTSRTTFPGATGAYTPPPANSPQPTQQRLLADDVVQSYDGVNNPLVVLDRRTDGEWPAGAKPVTTSTYVYDDSYRVTNVARTFAATTDAFVPPVAIASPAVAPLPMSTASSPAHRLQSQSFTYDGLGNLVASADDAQLMFDRSLGTVTTGNSAGVLGPNQLLSANLQSTNGDGSGGLTATYDLSGNLVQMAVLRNGNCTAPGGCHQLFQYDWDEVGRLSRARRFDFVGGLVCHLICIKQPEPSDYTYPNVPTFAPAADIQYSYDARGQRVVRASSHQGTAYYSVDIFPSLRLLDTTWDGAEYVANTDTEAVYLILGGRSFGRVTYNASAPSIAGPQHVFLELTDALGSTATVIDRDTSELVERTTHLSYGALDSDYRPDRWKNFREQYKFTGKEDDVEVGLTYFGARYYSPHLGRWISADPLAIHGMGGDLNPYAYVHGHVTTSIDPIGLEDGLGNQTISVAPPASVPPVYTLPTVTIVGDPSGGVLFDGPGIPVSDSQTPAPTTGQVSLKGELVQWVAAPGVDPGGFNMFAMFESSTNMPPGDWPSGLQSFPLSLEGTIYAPSANPYYSPRAFAAGFASGMGVPGISAPVSFAGPNVSQDYGFGLGTVAGTAFAMGIPLGKISWLGKAAAVEGVSVSPATRAGANLAKELASQGQLGEMAAGTGTPIAGVGTGKVFRDAARIAGTYGGSPADWVKMSSTGFRAADGTSFATHWVENVFTGQQVEEKVVVDVFKGP